MWEFNNSHQRCARQWREGVGPLPEVSVREGGSLMPSIKVTTLSRSSWSEVAWEHWKSSQFCSDGVIRSWHCIHGTLPTVLLYDLLVGKALCKDRLCWHGRSSAEVGKFWQLVLFWFGNQLMHGLLSCVVRVAGLYMLFCGGVRSVCFSYIGLLCYCLGFACVFITFLISESRLWDLLLFQQNIPLIYPNLQFKVAIGYFLHWSYLNIAV